jgi:hypothetical protein
LGPTGSGPIGSRARSRAARPKGLPGSAVIATVRRPRPWAAASASTEVVEMPVCDTTTTNASAPGGLERRNSSGPITITGQQWVPRNDGVVAIAAFFEVPEPTSTTSRMGAA